MTSPSPTNRLISTARGAIDRYGMIARESRVLIGVSGGPDSTALLHAVDRLKSHLGFTLAAAHLDHMLRDESHEEAEFVREMCARLGVPAYCDRRDVREFARREGMSVEQAGRVQRYEFFEEARKRAGADLIATAHHRDDAVETFFLRVLKGSSLAGLGGIPPVRGRIIRPFIDATRDEIIAFLDAEGLEYRLDPTNTTSDTDRNFIRNRIFPVIRERFPAFDEPLSRTIELIREENDALDRRANALYEKAVTPRPDGVDLSRDELRRAGRAESARVVVRAFYEAAGPNARFTREHAERFLDLVCGPNPSAKLPLPAGVAAAWEYDRIRLRKGDDTGPPGEMFVRVTGPGTVTLDEAGVTLHFDLRPRNADDRTDYRSEKRVFFDADAAPFPLTVRSPRPGDRIEPWGMEGTKKLADVLVDEKIPRRRRSVVPTLVMDDTVLWIAGIRRSRFAPVTDATRRVLRVTMDRSSGHFLARDDEHAAFLA